MLHAARFVRPTGPLRVAAACPPTLFRGYPGRSEMKDKNPQVCHSAEKSINLKSENEKEANLTGHDKPSHTIEHAPGWNEALASESEANVHLIVTGGETNRKIKAEKETYASIEILQEKTIKVCFSNR